ncbi:hypothetical protein K3758_05025 [Sulfitobacter sp. W002]|uniref:hypothetical protein n=1 Tax=Sulfitobacter sp. W002 TaxID=2867024 RepID=UPI0021A96683|nr:hypothetical protein [Sulfitobacter sp. W002]UWR30897.1 hypothetical protein K3758_05025 [Sulfitobacter sp. W002]
MGIYRIKHPQWLLDEIVGNYKPWAERTPGNTPDHSNGYGCGCTPLTSTGGTWTSSGNQGGIWNPVWRMYEVYLNTKKTEWTWAMRQNADHMWDKTGVFATPSFFGVPAQLHHLCDLDPYEAQIAIDNIKMGAAA